MRRGGPPMLPVEAGAVPALARMGRSPRGLRLEPAAGPAGAQTAPVPDLRLESAAPVPLSDAVAVANGELVLGASAGVAYSLAAPRLRAVHDRRPPGLDRVLGAAGANAGLLHADGGWRAVVLPSLGDIAADLGPGPVAIRADGRRLAVSAEDRVDEIDVGGGVVASHPGPAAALVYAADGTLLVAAGSAIGAPGAAPVGGAAIVALAAAGAAALVAALHEDGQVSVWEPGAAAPLASWASPVAGPRSLLVSDDGELVALAAGEGEPVAALARARDGALARWVEGARAIAPTTADGPLFLTGDWGSAWLTPLEEED